MPAVVQPGAVSAGASLQAQFANRQDLAQKNKLASLRQTAQELAAKGDWIGASNTMQIAVAMAPEDATVRAEAAEIQRRLNVHMVPQHTEEAREAERTRNWERAALLWGKVASAKPEDFESNYRLGKCLLTLGKDLPRAAEAARRAMAAAPRRAEPHVLLAEIFEAAGKPASAMSAAEQAAKLDPTSLAVKDLLARLR
jgi:tetratricopeptide (TPR) repeat protein